jgi:TRAP-type C4-dicarboxylate transport system permease small subunit
VIKRTISRTAGYLLGATVALMFVQVVLRFAFSRHSAWAEEVARYSFVWTVYLGTIVAVFNGTHIRVTFLTQKLGERSETLSLLLGRIVSLVSFAFVAFYGFKQVGVHWHEDFYTLPFLSIGIFFLSLPACMTVIVIYLLWPKRVRSTPPP